LLAWCLKCVVFGDDISQHETSVVGRIHRQISTTRCTANPAEISKAVADVYAINTQSVRGEENRAKGI